MGHSNVLYLFKDFLEQMVGKNRMIYPSFLGNKNRNTHKFYIIWKVMDNAGEWGCFQDSTATWWRFEYKLFILRCVQTFFFNTLRQVEIETLKYPYSPAFLITSQCLSGSYFCFRKMMGVGMDVLRCLIRICAWNI